MAANAIAARLPFDRGAPLRWRADTALGFRSVRVLGVVGTGRDLGSRQADEAVAAVEGDVQAQLPDVNTTSAAAMPAEMRARAAVDWRGFR